MCLEQYQEPKTLLIGSGFPRPGVLQRTASFHGSAARASVSMIRSQSWLRWLLLGGAVAAGWLNPSKGSLYAFRDQDAPVQDCTPDGPSLSDQVAVLCLAELRAPAAVTASPHHGDGQSRPAPGTARHRGPVV